MIILREVTRDNYVECLELKVRPDQASFVASNAYSLAESKFFADCYPRAIYNDDVMVGFIMYGIDSDDGNYWVARLMIDERYQSHGYGAEAMKQAMAAITCDKTHSKILISFEPENTHAEKLYTRLGFQHTGRVIEGELVMQYDYD